MYIMEVRYSSVPFPGVVPQPCTSFFTDYIYLCSHIFGLHIIPGSFWFVVVHSFLQCCRPGFTVRQTSFPQIHVHCFSMPTS